MVGLVLALAAARSNAAPFTLLGQSGARPIHVEQGARLTGGLLSEDGASLLYRNAPPISAIERTQLDLLDGQEREPPAVLPVRYGGHVALVTTTQAAHLGIKRTQELPHALAKDRPRVVAVIDSHRWVVEWAPSSHQAYLRKDRSYGEDVVNRVRYVSLIDLTDVSRIGPVLSEGVGHPGDLRISVGAKWVATGRTLEVVEARRAGAKFQVWASSFSFSRKEVTRRRLPDLPARRGSFDLGIASASMDGRLAVLYGTSAAPRTQNRTDATFIWRSGTLFLAHPPIAPMVWCNQIVAFSPRSRGSDEVTTSVFDGRGWRTVATGWRWIAWNSSQSKLLAVEQATGKGYVISFG